MLPNFWEQMFILSSVKTTQETVITAESKVKFPREYERLLWMLNLNVGHWNLQIMGI
jgi:hypothetical protein